MRNAWDDECTAFEEEFEQKQRRATASNNAGIDLATLRRSFCLGRAMLVTTVSNIGDSMISACIRQQAQTPAVSKANTYRIGANIMSRICSFEGCRNFLFAQMRGAIKLGRMLQALQPNWKKTAAFKGFDSKLIGVDQQLLIKYIKHRVVPILKRLERLHAWNMADAVQQLITSIVSSRGQTRCSPPVAE